MKTTADEKYLIEPFNKFINKKGFATNINTMNMIVGTTGLGKTYRTFNKFIPTLFEEHDLDCIIYTYPMTEIYEPMLAKEVVSEHTRGVYLAENLIDAMNLINKGKKVLLCCCHQSIVGWKGKRFLKSLESNGLKTSWFVDESHSWMASHMDNYREITGSHTPEYEAVMYNMVSKLAERSPYIFGLTATPQAEQIKLVDVKGSMDFNTINKYPKLEEVVSRAGWMGGVTHFNLGSSHTSAGQETLNVFYDALFDHLNRSHLYGKTCMMIQSERANGKFGWDRKHIEEMLKEYYKHHSVPEASLCESHDMVAVLSSEFTGFVNFKPKGFGITIDRTKSTEQEVKNALANPEHACQILIVIEKGKMGMNIHNLKTYMSFRKTDKEMSSKYDNKPITETAKQIVGRFMRIWTGMTNEKFVKEYGYDLTEYVKNLDEDGLKSLFKLNSYYLYVPNNEMWRAAIKMIKKDLSPSIETANAWVKQIRN
tara:strand:+ start:101 stop:1546 length:1446 start_codon:yes stop_codon:yes gene_type:complete